MASTAEAVRLTGVGQIAVRAKDLSRAAAFYRDTLGLRQLLEIPGAVFFDCGGVRLMVGVAEGAEFDHPASVIYYRVDDIEAVCSGLQARGVRFEREPHLIARMPDHDLWMAFLRDSEDNVLGLMEERRGRE